MGTKRFGLVVVVDIEATCWEPMEEQEDQPSEIIEIGVCLLNTKSFEISRKNSYLVRPKYSKVSGFCTELTGHTWDTLKTAMPLEGACNKLVKDYGTRNRIWASWGDSDRIHFINECEDKGIKYPFGNSHINISDLFSLSRGLDSRVGLEKALSLIGKDFEGKPHSGCDDAYNTALILREILIPFREKHFDLRRDHE